MCGGSIDTSHGRRRELQRLQVSLNVARRRSPGCCVLRVKNCCALLDGWSGPETKSRNTSRLAGLRHHALRRPEAGADRRQNKANEGTHILHVMSCAPHRNPLHTPPDANPQAAVFSYTR
ncbi:unnamed protein product, partial [Ectocarpus sp. 4 AP-2014]